MLCLGLARGRVLPRTRPDLVLALALCGAAWGCGDSSPSTTRADETSGNDSLTTTSTTTPTSTTTTDSGPTSTSAPTGSETDPPQTGSTTMDSDSTSTGDPTFCPDTHKCVARAPKGWEGPVFVLDLDPDPEESPTCPDAYPTLEVDAFSGLDADPASCQCSCGPANGATCQNSTTLNYWGDSAECSGGSSVSLTVFGGTCSSLPGTFPNNTYWQLEPVEARGGACVPTTTESKSDPTWSTRVAGCGGANLIEDVCASGRVCTPLASDDDSAKGDYCIWRTGEHECPDDFDTTRVVFEETDDQRSCSACSCSDPSGLCDTARVLATATSTCMAPFSGTLPANNECVQTFGGQTGGVLLDPGEPTAFCSPSAPMAAGEVVGSEPTTICCVG